jgi:hypothetical protein
MALLVVEYTGDHTRDHLAQVVPFALGNALFLGVRDGPVALFLAGLAPYAIASLPHASLSPEKRESLCHYIRQVYHMAHQGGARGPSMEEVVH